MTVENLGNHDSNSETTTAANKQRFHEQKDTLCTCFSHWSTFLVSGLVYDTVSGQICRSPKSPLTKQIITCKVFPAPCEEKRYTMVDSLFLFKFQSSNAI